MKIEIKRYTTEPEERSALIAYEIDQKAQTLLEALNYIKTKLDPSLSFSSGCRSSVCGSCAVLVNGKEALACSHKIKEGDVIEPLKNMPILRDLVVDSQVAYEFNKKAKAWQSSHAKTQTLSIEDEKRNEVQSDCIMCSSCFSACPVYSVNDSFLGPFALTRVWRYVSDARESEEQTKIENIQTNGIWECTLCNECTIACPQGISSKGDIEKLRSKSAMHGFMDPNFARSFGGGFSGGFGFDGSPTF